MHSLLARHHQRPEHQQPVDNQKLVAEFVAEEPLLGMRGEDVAERGDGKGDDRHEPTTRLRYFAFREHAEGEQAEDGTVGVGGHHEDDADERVVVVVRHDDDDHQEEHRDDQVDNAAHVNLLFL